MVYAYHLATWRRDSQELPIPRSEPPVREPVARVVHNEIVKRRFSVLLIAAVLASVIPPVEATAVELTSYVPGELLVGFAHGVDRSHTASVHRRRGAVVLKHFDEIGVDLVRLPPGSTLDQERIAYQSQRSVLFAEPNALRRAYGVTPNDPAFPDQWGLKNTGQIVNGDPGLPDADIDASEPGATADAWQITTGSTQTVVAVIDTGVEIAHPDLSANIWTNPGEIAGNNIDDDANGYVDDINGWDFADENSSVYDPTQICGGQPNDRHGTHVSGILGAVGNNGVGIAGVNWNVRIMPLKFLTKIGSNCGVGSDSDAIEAILYATKMGAQFINASWGGDQPTEALRQAFIAAGRGEVLFAAAAGNGGIDGVGDDLSLIPDYPASFDLENEIVVAASNNDDGLASFSNFGGPTDLAAPGVTILSTVPGDYAYLSGTSMATPFVTGALALLHSQYPHAPPLELKDRVLATVESKPAFTSPNTVTGGRLNLNSAIRQVRPVVPTLVAPNGGEQLLPGSSFPINWSTHIPASNPTTSYRIEFTPDALATTTSTADFELGLPTDFVEPLDSDAPWTTSATAPHSGTLSAKSGALGNDQASWLSTTRTLGVTGTVSFWFRLSSENCESLPSQPVCGDYLRFFIDGTPVFGRAGVVGWTHFSFPVGAGTHEFTWSYQKDELCPGTEPVCAGTETLEDAVWIDDVQITGIDNVVWTLVDLTAPGATTYPWTVPNIATTRAKVRVCQDAGPCQTTISDESDEVFEILASALSINDVTVTEGEIGTTPAIFTITLTPASGQTVTVDFATANGTATAPADYTSATGTVIFAPGVTTQTVNVLVQGDNLDEANETFTVNLTSPTIATITDNQGLGTITDDDAAPELSINNVTVTEGDTGTTTAGFSVTMSAASGQTVTVDFATVNGTATAPSDYASATGTVTFAPGTTTQPVNISVQGDTVDEPNEAFTVNLSAPTNATIFDGQGVGTITNDDVQRFTALTPSRILDTRDGTGDCTPACLGAIAGGTSKTVQIVGQGGVPATSTVSAVVLNVTVTEPTAAGFLTVYPSGSPKPLASNLNFVPGQTVPNLVKVKVGPDGKIVVFNSGGNTQVIFDVAGWYSDGTQVINHGAYTPVPPHRLLDTRGGAGIPVGPGSFINVQVTGAGGVPAPGVSAAAMNVTVDSPTSAGYLTVWPTGSTRPLASNLNFIPGQNVPNMAIVKTGNLGQVSVFNSGPGTVHVIIDVGGWYSDDTITVDGGSYDPLVPFRILDTRNTVALAPGEAREVQVTGLGGIPGAGVGAVVMNTTVTEPGDIGYLTVYPAGTTRPLASNLNFVGGQTVPNLVMVKVGTGGKVVLYNGSSSSVQVVLDVGGWFSA